MYSKLDPSKVIETLETLNHRISERFPNRGLAQVCHELTKIAKLSSERAHDIARPNIFLRLTVWTIIIFGLVALGYAFKLIKLESVTSEVASFLQGIEAAMNTVFLAGVAIFSLVKIEERYKRRQALQYLDELRAIIHVIDMHQLTKDPTAILSDGPQTESSPERTLSEFELMRYLDYCSEMLSLTGKIAALYAQTFRDHQVVAAVNDIEQLATNLSRKIWQKITLIKMQGTVHDV